MFAKRVGLSILHLDLAQAVAHALPVEGFKRLCGRLVTSLFIYQSDSRGFRIQFWISEYLCGWYCCGPWVTPPLIYQINSRGFQIQFCCCCCFHYLLRYFCLYNAILKMLFLLSLRRLPVPSQSFSLIGSACQTFWCITLQSAGLLPSAETARIRSFTMSEITNKAKRLYYW